MNTEKMPRYLCHMEAHALKIREVDHMTEGAILVPEEEGYPSFTVDQGFVEKYGPVPGGYYVVYDGDYETYSHAKTFESNYTQIGVGDGPEEAVPVEKITASEALFGFGAWITTRPGALVLGATHDASPIAKLLDEWLSVNHLPRPREDVYPGNITQPTE